ncbi:UNVERIFIED_CONTAM: Retrovirus-related Pol polyprotein from transposon TNT 1-94 [Sesamum angustifolium]|uniref:Retrovirus-related Pol polyprotein from transposon TNT 1-94 n=1 Tax=Sesamum angustifolium TaxID=2727405 RepID=A0AAW2LWC1_9LAMI
MKIHRERGSRKLWLSQRGYVEKVLDKFILMNKAKPVSTPLRNDPLVVRYVDSDYASDLDYRRSETGYVSTLGGGPICWKSTVQSIVTLSTNEAKYMAVAEAAKEALWLNGLAKELSVEQGGVQLHCDSQSAIYLAKNQVYRARIKHIDVRYQTIRKLIAFGEIILQTFVMKSMLSRGKKKKKVGVLGFKLLSSHLSTLD